MIHTRERDSAPTVLSRSLLYWVTALVVVCAGSVRVAAQELDFTSVRAEVNFSKKLQTWDGFSFNYMETCQTRDYGRNPQEYGGFSLLQGEDKQKILDLVFGEDGTIVYEAAGGSVTTFFAGE